MNFYYSRRFFTKKQLKKLSIILIAAFVFQHSAHSPLIEAVQAAELSPLEQNQVTISAPEAEQELEIKTVDKKVIKQMVASSRVRAISAYNAGDIYQTDGNPCVAANGEDICAALAAGYKRCAANFVPFGTILEIEGYGQCLVVDRMNSRYPENVDIAMPYDQKAEALKFGRRQLMVKIIKLIKTEVN